MSKCGPTRGPPVHPYPAALLGWRRLIAANPRGPRRCIARTRRTLPPARASTVCIAFPAFLHWTQEQPRLRQPSPPTVTVAELSRLCSVGQAGKSFRERAADRRPLATPLGVLQVLPRFFLADDHIGIGARA